ncbi:MAG: LppC family lipoprotein [Glaciimonas sp.]|nr:LppC family lipoprotein [Glaciimonas sp.]
MSYQWIKILLLCSALVGCSSVSLAPIFDRCGAANALCAPVPANTTMPAATATPLPGTGFQLVPEAQTSSVAAPDVAVFMPGKPLAARIALLLPLRSETLGAAAEAVRAGFMAAYAREQEGVTVTVIATDDVAAQTLSAYLDAQASQDVIVGPLSRSGVSAIAQSGAVRIPTIALNQPMLGARDEAAAPLPPKMLAMGLSLEDEARQVARWASLDHPGASAFVVGANIAWQRRAASAFTAEWRRLGLSSQSIELGLVDGYLNATALAQLRSRLQNERPVLLFVSMDAGLTRQLRQAIGTEVPVYGTSQINPLIGTDSADKLADPLVEGLHFVDLPWQLQPDHPAVMVYPRLVTGADQKSNPDMERLYALGIDAYRVAREIAAAHEQFEIDGVTGRLAVTFGPDRASFDRITPQAVYQDGTMLLPGMR